MLDRQDEKIMAVFGKNLKKTRLEKGWSLRQLAHEADMSHFNIHEIEKGIVNPSLTTIMGLARALEVDPGALMPK